MSREHVSAEELARLRALSDAGSPPPWTAFVEGRDFLGGDSVIRIGGLDDQHDDMYVYREARPAAAADLDLVAEARTYLPRLLDEIERLRAASA